MLKSSLIILFSLLLVACGGGGGDDDSNSSSSSRRLSIADSPLIIASTASLSCSGLSGPTVIVSGTIQYERVPFSGSARGGLDYNNIQTLPVRGVVVEAISSNGCVMATTITSSMGNYALVVQQNQSIKIRVKAQIFNNGLAKWDFEVRDNTRSNGLYIVEGAFINTGVTDSIRNLKATTGWNGSAYTGVRASAPFAILASVYDAVKKVEAVDSDVIMDDADIFWSVNNSSAQGEKSLGEITTSHYLNDELYILGQANHDTDEFDTHVIIHEWGHYFEDNLSRLDSIGGQHSRDNLLDMRVALGEGFGNAFSGMVTDDPVYRDSYGDSQAIDFHIDVDENSHSFPGWFSESSVQSILYDIYDADGDSNDAVNLGFSAIYNAMTSNAYINQSSMTSLFSLIDELKTQNTSEASAIDVLVAGQTKAGSDLLGIDSIIDKYGSNETHKGYETGTFLSSIPIYSSITDDGIPVEICSHNLAQEQNGLGVRQFLRLNIISAGSHTIKAVYSRGSIPQSESNPDFVFYLNGEFDGVARSRITGEDQDTDSFNADEYILEVYEYSNVDGINSTGGSVCFNVSVTDA